MTLLPWRWSAPETIESNGKTMSTASDVFMLGITFWEMLCITRRPYNQLGKPKQLLKEYKAGKCTNGRLGDTGEPPASFVQATSRW